tara:strand:+ start:38 stop:484 length:447 start_codon:yes stop_codon:yes gene_type:complete
MKKLTTLILISAISITMAGEGNENLYTKLKANHTETFSMSLSKSMIDFFDMDLDFNGKEKLITGDFHEGKLMVLEDVIAVESITKIFAAEKYELIEDEEEKMNAENGEVFLYIMRKGATISEAHFVIANDEGKITILSVLGDIKVKNK